jgi:hypothetical protein
LPLANCPRLQRCSSSLTFASAQAECQRNFDMLQRARADLANERQRSEQVLLEIARFEAEKTNMKQTISG